MNLLEGLCSIIASISEDDLQLILSMLRRTGDVLKVIHIPLAAPGCSGANSVMSQTWPSITTQQSAGVSCSAICVAERSLGSPILGIGASGRVHQGTESNAMKCFLLVPTIKSVLMVMLNVRKHQANRDANVVVPEGFSADPDLDLASSRCGLPNTLSVYHNCLV